jgi:DNA-directed DNA polymerase III PolC
VKFDFLGLTTLTILDWAERFVRAMGDAQFALERIPLDDKAAYQLLSAGNTTAVFQLESRGMRDLIKRARPDCFEDVIALVALYRPGPMDLIPDFIARKHGSQRVEYLDPRLEPILRPTYGIMVYQEQVMQIGQVIGGLTLGGADLLRRAMGKKKAEEMAQQRDVFVSGAEKNGLSRGKATQLFDLMEKFAGYGFNRSHAAAYALLAYQTAYMKAHHASAFMAANLSLVMGDTDKVRQFHEDALANGLSVLPPDINASECPSMRTPCATAWAQCAAPASRRSTPSSKRAKRGRSPICSIYAGAWTSASSTAASSKRWCARARSTRSSPIAPACSPRRAARSRRPSSASARRRRSACSATRRTPAGPRAR